MKIKDYSKEDDIVYIHFGKNKTEESIELQNATIVLDLDKNLNIVGFEIFDFMKKVKEHQNRMKND